MPVLSERLGRITREASVLRHTAPELLRHPAFSADGAISQRTAPLPDLCVEALREHRERQRVEHSEVGRDWTDHGLVFPSAAGTPMEPDNLRRSWGRIRAAAGLDGMRFHDLRHTCVTLLLNLGVPPRSFGRSSDTATLR